MFRFVVDPNERISSHLALDHTWFQWLLSHGAYSLRHLENPLFSMRQNVPDGVNMMANTSVLGVTIPLAPITMLFGPRVAYVVWMIAACAGTATATYWVLSRHLKYSWPAALVAGAFAGFAPGVMHHGNGQPNFVSNFVLPFIVVAALRLGTSGRPWREGMILGLLVSYQVFINEELLLIAASACGTAIVAWAVQQRDMARRRARSFFAALSVTAVVAGALCAYPIWFQFFGPQTYRGLPVYHDMGEDLLAYITFSRDTLAGDDVVEKTLGASEQNTWYGWPLMLFAVVTVLLLWRQSARVRIAAMVAAVFAVLGLGSRVTVGGEDTSVPGLWAWIPDDLPVLSMLSPPRLTFVVTGCIVLLIAEAWEALRQKPGATSIADRWGRAMIIATLVPIIPTPLPAKQDEPSPAFITSGAWRDYVPPGRTLIPVPLPSGYFEGETLSWSADAQLEFPVPEGYFLGPNPNGVGHAGEGTLSVTAELIHRTKFSGLVPALTADMVSQAWADVRRWKGAIVVLPAVQSNEPTRALLNQLFGPAEQRMDVWLWDVRE